MFHFLDLLNWWHEKGTEERKKKVVTFFTLQSSSSGRNFVRICGAKRQKKYVRKRKKKIGRERRVGFLLLAHKVLMEWWFIIKNEAAVREWDSVEKFFLVLDRSSFFWWTLGVNFWIFFLVDEFVDFLDDWLISWGEIETVGFWYL